MKQWISMWVFQTLDTNGDRLLSRSEYEALYPPATQVGHRMACGYPRPLTPLLLTPPLRVVTEWRACILAPLPPEWRACTLPHFPVTQVLRVTSLLVCIACGFPPGHKGTGCDLLPWCVPL